jgi:hypothetical protein
MGIGVVAAIMAPQYFDVGATDRVVKTNLPLIRTTVYSEERDKDVTVSALFTVELDQETRRLVSNEILHQELTEIVSSMDMQALVAANGIEYVNNYATRELNKRLSEITETETNVFAYDLYVGDRVAFTGPENQQGEFFDAMSTRRR